MNERGYVTAARQRVRDAEGGTMARHTRSRQSALAGFAVLALLVAACGDDDDSASGGTDAPATTDAAATTAAGTETTAAPETTVAAETTAPEGDGGDAGSVDAQARVDAFREPVTELPVGDPVTVEAGTKVFYVQCSVPVCEEIGIGIEAAAEAAGWELEVASHQDTPDTVASAFDAAIAAQPDVVLTSGNPREWFASQLATLQEQGIPIVAW